MKLLAVLVALGFVFESVIANEPWLVRRDFHSEPRPSQMALYEYGVGSGG